MGFALSSTICSLMCCGIVTRYEWVNAFHPSVLLHPYLVSSSSCVVADGQALLKNSTEAMKESRVFEILESVSFFLKVSFPYN